MIHCIKGLDYSSRPNCFLSMLLAFILGAALLNQSSAIAASISLSNPGFDDVSGIVGQNNGGDWSLNNTFNFGNGNYNGWTVAAGVSGTGVINVDPGDMSLPSQATSGEMALLFSQTAFRSARQTTSHVISAVDTAFTLTFDLGSGKSGTIDYEVLLYGDDGVTRSYFASLAETATNASPGTWSSKVLVAPQSLFASFIGQAVGIELRHTSGIELFVDTVDLSVSQIPEPTSGLMVFVAVLMGAARRCQFTSYFE